MDHNIFARAAGALREKFRKGKRRKAFALLAAVLVLCMIQTLILPAFALEPDEAAGQQTEASEESQAGYSGGTEGGTTAQAENGTTAETEGRTEAAAGQQTEASEESQDGHSGETEGGTTAQAKNETTAETESRTEAAAGPQTEASEESQDGHSGRTEGGTTAETESEASVETENETASETAAETEGETAAETESGTEPGKIYFFENASIEVTVSLAEDSEVPTDAALAVRAVTEDDAAWESLAQQAEETVAGQASRMLFYDISFYTANQEYLPVSDTAIVSVRFRETVITEAEEIAVLHYDEEEKAPVVLTGVDAELDGEEGLQTLTFWTEGFSVYGVVAVTSGMAEAETVDLDELGGKSYAILSHTGRYAMLAEQSGSTMLSYQSGTEGLPGTGLWAFTAVSGGYVISCGGNYLQMSSGSLTLSAFADRASVFTVSLYDGQYILISSGGYYINSYGGESNMQGFGGWTGNDAGSQLLFYEIPANHVTNLGGRTFAIVNETMNAGLTAEAGEDEVAGMHSLAPAPVNFDGSGHVAGDGLALWLFEASDEEWAYYISATDVQDSKRYLNMELKNAVQGSLTLSDTPQKIYVTAAADGKVLLSITENGGGYLNSSSSGGGRFWVYNGSGDYSRQTLCEFIADDDAVLYYDLGVSESSVGGHPVGGDRWSEEPSVENTAQAVSEEGVSLYRVSGDKDEDGYYSREYTASSGNLGSVSGYLKDKGEACGKQFRFDGWSAQIDGVTSYFAVDAKAAAQEDGIHILDKSGTERVLPSGTTLKGVWTEVSDIATFYVNYTGTILDTEGNVSGRNQKDFTGIVGIGHVYFGTETVGSDETFASDANEKIRVMFANSFDENSDTCQVVMSYVTVWKNGADYWYQAATGINDAELEQYLLKYIRDSGITIRVSTAEGINNPAIDNENATTDNYTVRWYVLKEQTDGWHIDGVMVAKTAEITVGKTFSGLKDAQVAALLAAQDGNYDNSFRIPVQIGDSAQDYITMTTADGGGQYSWYGREQTADGAGGQSYTWVLNAITDEKYTLSEDNYEAAGYDVSTITVNYYKDAEDTGIAYGYSPTTAGLGVVGGSTAAVTFNNFYTKTGTGALSIIKRAAASGENDVGGVLAGAEFTLYDSSGNEAAVSVSNSRGAAYFSDLEPGTYLLKETEAPAGYLASELTWTVEAARESSGSVTVTVYENDENGNRTGTGILCYDGGIKQSYPIENAPSGGTIRVTKTFKELTALQMEGIVQKSTETAGGYYILFDGMSEGAAESSTEKRLYLHEANRSQDGFTFTWTIQDLTLTNADGNAVAYCVSEHNYLAGDLADAYIDTIVAAYINDTEKAVTIDRTDLSAAAYIRDIEFAPDSNNTVLLTNTYINEFTLSLQKLDGSTGEPLAGAEFDIYGAYREATDSVNSITYTDPDTGRLQKAYYIATIRSNASGLAVQRGMKLSAGNNTFVYILREDRAPDGYMASSEPTIVTVEVSSENYDAGVYSLSVGNSKYVEVTVRKQVTGNLGDLKKRFDFTVEVTDSGGARVTELTAEKNAGYTVNEDGTLSFGLKHGGEVTLLLPEGYSFTVTEDEADSDGYQTTYSADGAAAASGVFSAFDGMTVTVENHRDTNVSTGVTLPELPFLILPVSAAAVAAGLYIEGRRRRNGT